MSPRKDHGDSNLLWVVGVLLCMACSCAVYTGHIIDSTLNSLRTSNTMALLITSDGFKSDDAKLEAQLNQAQKALQDSADIALALTIACLIVAIGLIIRVSIGRGLLAAAMAATLTGCAWWSSDEPVAKPADVPKQGTLTTIGEDIDKADSRVAAAVTIAVENADKPGVVKSEGGLALSYLPKPEEGDVAIARARAAKADPAAYLAEMKQAKEFLQKVEKDWSTAVDASKRNAAEVEKARGDLNTAKGEIEKLKLEVKRVESEGSRNVWTMTGAGLVICGGLAMALAGPKVGIPLLLCGAFAGAVPHIIDSPYFGWIAGVTMAVCAALGLWWVYDVVRDRVKASEGKQET